MQALSIFPDVLILTGMKRSTRNISRTVVLFFKKRQHQKQERSVLGKLSILCSHSEQNVWSGLGDFRNSSVDSASQIILRVIVCPIIMTMSFLALF